MQYVFSHPCALSELRDQLGRSTGVGSLLRGAAFDAPFAFVGETFDTARQCDFEYGGVARQGLADKELRNFVRSAGRGHRGLWALFEDPWSKEGDLANSDANVADCFVFGGVYHHLCRTPNQVPIPYWRSLSVSYQKILLLVRLDLSQIMLVEEPAAPRETVEKIVQATEFVFVSAYDDESWLGARVKTMA